MHARWFAVALCTCLMRCATPATAEVLSAGPITASRSSTASTWSFPSPRPSPPSARSANGGARTHTYSGDAARMSLQMRPGGCFCETLDGGGGIEHMRVTYVQPGERMVLTGSLGPLLYEATAGVMDVKVERIAGGSRVTMNYRAAGFAKGGAAKMAPLVDQVLGEQMKRFRVYAAGGAPKR